MVTNEYERRKNEVLDVYDKFIDNFNELKEILENAGIEHNLNRFGSLKDIEKNINNIRADRFKLMVAGEAKSGKSTFINAYLGMELLPMDIKTCTSAIIVIRYGKKFKLIAEYADGTHIPVEKEDEIIEFLKVNASISDKYRDIPVPAINQLIVNRAKEDKKVTEQEIKAFLELPVIMEANTEHKNDYKEYENKIRKYISVTQKHWEEIVVNIELYYPFKDKALKGIEIIDSPGVHVRGTEAAITEKYIEEADSIIYLKPVSASAAVSASFNNFLDSTSASREENTLFLVLTRAADVTSNGLKEAKKDAYRVFNNTFNRENIIAVDSKAKLYSYIFSKCENSQAVTDTMTAMNTAGTLEHFVKGIWFDSNSDKFKFIDLLNETSNFKEIETALSTFGRKAHFIRISNTLEKLSKLFDSIKDSVDSDIASLNTKAEDPIKLALQIEEIQSKLDEIEGAIGEGLDKAVSKFNGNNGLISTIADKAAQEYLKEVRAIDPGAANSIDALNKCAFKKIKDYESLQEKLQKQVVEEFNNLLKVKADEAQIPYTALEPDFSEKDFEQLKQDTKKKANVDEIVGRRCFKDIIEKRYSRSRHFKLVNDHIVSKLDEIKDQLVNNLTVFVRNIRKQYRDMLEKNADAEKAHQQSIRQAQIESEALAGLIEKLEAMKTYYTEVGKKIREDKEAIDEYVQ